MSLWDFFFGKKISIRKNLRWTGYKVPEPFKYDDYWPEMKEDMIEMIGTPYRYGEEVSVFEWPAKKIDCSEMVELLHGRRSVPCPDGAFAQHKASYKVDVPRPGDLGFLTKASKIASWNPLGISHVFMLYSSNSIIEARGGSIGKVVVLPRAEWENDARFIEAGSWRRLKVLKRS